MYADKTPKTCPEHSKFYIRYILNDYVVFRDGISVWEATAAKDATQIARLMLQLDTCKRALEQITRRNIAPDQKLTASQEIIAQQALDYVEEVNQFNLIYMWEEE